MRAPHCSCSEVLGVMLVLTVPQLLIGSVNAEITEAAFKDVLDTILGAGALLHLLRPVSVGHPPQEKQKVASKNANRADTLSLCSSETNELHFFWVQKPVAAVADD